MFDKTSTWLHVLFKKTHKGMIMSETFLSESFKWWMCKLWIVGTLFSLLHYGTVPMCFRAVMWVKIKQATCSNISVLNMKYCVAHKDSIFYTSFIILTPPLPHPPLGFPLITQKKDKL